LYALDCLLSVLTKTHDNHAAHGFAVSIELNYAAPDLGTVDHGGDVTHQHRSAGLRVVRDDDVLDVFQRLDIPAPSHHVLAAGHFHQSGAHIVVSLLNGAYHRVDRDLVTQQLVGIDVDLVFADEAAGGSDLRHAWHRLQRIAQIPVLVSAHLFQAVLCGRIHKGVLVDPSDRRSILRQFNIHALGKAGCDGVEILQRARARPINVCPFVKDDVDIGIAEVAEAPHVLHLGHAQQGRGYWVGDLVFHDVGAAVPFGVHNHLRVGEVRNGIQLCVLHGLP